MTRRAYWPLPALALATTLIAIGGVWDISWHLTIGRDTFWTPAHMAIYLGGAGGGCICGWLAIQATFLSTPAERAGTVRILGASAPFGAWIGIWGAVAMLTSAPFDNWWHNAYGLDVKIISPPHVLLFLGMIALRLGTWILLLREQNRADSAPSAPWLFCWVGGLAMSGILGIFLVETWPNRQHTAHYVELISGLVPFFLVAVSRASRFRWGATLAAGSAMFFTCCMLWILPLFAATPRLGPIYNPLTHLVPPPFPQLTLLPAIAFDLFRQWRNDRTPSWRSDLENAVAFAVLFLLVFLPAQWLFARFDLSRAADNAFFAGAGRGFGYNTLPGPHLTEFWGNEDGSSLHTLVIAGLIAYVSAVIGQRFGRWMTRVQR